MNLNMIIPVAIVILSNTFYNICSKATPEDINPFAALSVTYLVGTAVALALYFISSKGGSLVAEYGKLNWSSFVLGIAIVGLEAGFILMYRAGWNISTGQVVASIGLTVVLVFVSTLAYKEQLTLSRVAGILICMVGLYFINK